MESKELDKYIVKYINGDNDAFDEIYHETKKTVYLSIKSIIKNQETINDLMQDTYIKAINCLEMYKLGTNFKAWIAMMARNITINYYNKNKKEQIIDPIENEYEFKSEDKRDSLLGKAQKVLSSQEYDIIIYYFVLNFKFKEIAKIYEMPLSSVYFIYKTALKKIKEEI